MGLMVILLFLYGLQGWNEILCVRLSEGYLGRFSVIFMFSLYVQLSVREKLCVLHIQLIVG